MCLHEFVRLVARESTRFDVVFYVEHFL